MPSGSSFYGIGATLNSTGAVVDHGRVNGTLVIEYIGYTAISLTTMVLAIISQELVRTATILSLSD